MKSKPQIIKAPESYDGSYPSIFLAGSIEMGTAKDWQSIFYEEIYHRPVTIFSPRRDDWDASWEQSMDNPNFYEQVSWELDRLEECDVIAMYYDPNTKSPISLLELGLYARSGKLIVCCPTGFWRQGNVAIVCSKYGIPLFENENAWRVAIINSLKDKYAGFPNPPIKH